MKRCMHKTRMCTHIFYENEIILSSNKILLSLTNLEHITAA